jgi:hypothetical protein
MGGGTGNLRTSRLSATSGSRTFASMIANGLSGAGSYRRVYKYYANLGQLAQFYALLGIRRR